MRIRLEVPATSANLGPGYDAFGLALGIADVVALTVHDAPVDPESCVEISGEGATTLPRDRSHLIMRVIEEVLAAEYPRLGQQLAARLSLECANEIPHSRGLGSSAAAAVAGVGLAAELGHQITGNGLSRQRVLELATAYEGHPDNAAPAVFGGLTIAVSGPARAWQVPVRTLSEVTVLVPDVRLDTHVARSLVPATVDHAAAAENSARAALLVHGLVNDASVLVEATADRLHQEFRRRAYPESMALVDALRDQGLPAVISGAGPTVLVLSDALPADGTADSVRSIRTAIDLGGYRVRTQR